MITYEFTAPVETCRIFQTHKEDVIDYLEIPLRIRIPHRLAIEVGLDRLNNRIGDAMDTVVKTLKHDCKIS